MRPVQVGDATGVLGSQRGPLGGGRVVAQDRGPHGKYQPGWCPRCASRQSDMASQSYCDKSLDVESVMSEHWREPTGRVVVPGNIVAKAHLGRVPPKAPPPGISSLATQDRLAALEEEVARLRLRVAQLEEHSSGAATGSSS